MKEHPDINDTLRAEGPDAVRTRHDQAHKPNGKARQFVLTPFDAITLSATRNYLVKGILPRVGLAVIWGPPKCGKSFWTFDVAMHIALGWPYRGRKVQQGAVVYLALEGGHGFRARVVAWRQQHLAEHHGPVPFFLLDIPVDLVRDHMTLIAAIRAQLGGQMPAVVVVDTLNRALLGDENNPKDMSIFIRAIDAIRDTFDCLVPIVHHCGIQGGRPRGHTSLTGADDVQIAIERDKDNNVIAKVEHMKDGEAGAVIASRLETVELGTDDDGDPQASCIVVPVDIGTTSASFCASIRMTGNQRRFLDILNHAILTAKPEHKNVDIPNSVSREWLKNCCKSKGWFDTEASENNNRAKVSNMLNALAGRQIVGLSNLYVWRNEP